MKNLQCPKCEKSYSLDEIQLVIPVSNDEKRGFKIDFYCHTCKKVTGWTCIEQGDLVPSAKVNSIQ